MYDRGAPTAYTHVRFVMWPVIAATTAGISVGPQHHIRRKMTLKFCIPNSVESVIPEFTIRLPEIEATAYPVTGCFPVDKHAPTSEKSWTNLCLPNSAVRSVTTIGINEKPLIGIGRLFGADNRPILYRCTSKIFS